MYWIVGLVVGATATAYLGFQTATDSEKTVFAFAASGWLLLLAGVSFLRRIGLISLGLGPEEFAGRSRGPSQRKSSIRRGRMNPAQAKVAAARMLLTREALSRYSYSSTPLGTADSVFVLIAVETEGGVRAFIVNEDNLKSYQEKMPYRAYGIGTVRRYAGEVRLPQRQRWYLVLENRLSQPAVVDLGFEAF